MKVVLHFVARKGKLLAIFAHNTVMHEDIVVLSIRADARMYLVDSRELDVVAPISAVLADVVAASDYSGFGW